jgi:hypothetical protein
MYKTKLYLSYLLIYFLNKSILNKLVIKSTIKIKLLQI